MYHVWTVLPELASVFLFPYFARNNRSINRRRTRLRANRRYRRDQYC
jgi:hypothetical protein